MSLLNEFKKLSFKNEQEENDFIGYCTNIMSSKISGPVPNSHIIIPEKRTYILLKYFCRGNKYFFLCNKCFDVDLIENLSIETDLSEMENSYCYHARAAKVIWSSSSDLIDDPKINDDGEVHFLQEKPVLLSIVYPPKDNLKKLPAVVCVTSKMF